MPRALHRHHHLLGGLPPGDPEGVSAAADRDWLRTARQEYGDRGFTRPVPLLRPEAVERLTERLELMQREIGTLEAELYEVEAAWQRAPDTVPLHFLGAWMIDEAFHDLVFHPRLTRFAAALLDVPRLRLWHDQVFAKPAGHRGVVPWHQDAAYWTRVTPERFVTAHVALDGIDEENGGIRYVPGSHGWPLLPSVAFDAPMEGGLGTLDPERRAAIATAACPRLAPGDVVFHHPRVLHGSFENASARPRRAAVVNYMADGVRARNGGLPLLRGTPPLPDGARVTGDHFPLVLDTTEPGR